MVRDVAVAVVDVAGNVFFFFRNNMLLMITPAEEVMVEKVGKQNGRNVMRDDGGRGVHHGLAFLGEDALGAQS
jgi:hypothetical protein